MDQILYITDNIRYEKVFIVIQIQDRINYRLRIILGLFLNFKITILDSYLLFFQYIFAYEIGYFSLIKQLLMAAYLLNRQVRIHRSVRIIEI